METKIQEIRGHFGLPSQDASKDAKWTPNWIKNGRKMEPQGSQVVKKSDKMEPKGAKSELDLETSSGMPRGGEKIKHEPKWST